jgi:pyrimidine operon attenuation protein/uracil phosphoribosyltransferase
VGTHQNYNSVHILNGLGTRGVMLGPAMAKALYENIEYQVPLNTEIDIKDFKKTIRVILYLGHEENMLM